jgi:glycosyltransferase involved in cell wall biosynthesis
MRSDAEGASGTNSTPRRSEPDPSPAPDALIVPGSNPISVMIDAQTLSSVAQGGGISSYTRALLAQLAARSDIAVSALADGGVTLPDGVTRIPLHRLVRQPRLESVEHAVRVPFDVRRHRPPGAVFHNPSFHAPRGIRVPWVQTLLDVIPLIDDAPDLAVLRSRWKRFGPRYQQASAIIAISRHAADEGMRLLNLDADKVTVAHLGVDPKFCPSISTDGPADPPYLLVVSEFSARKGFAEAFAVQDALVEAGYPHQLVVAGRVQPWAKDDLARLHARARHPERIEIRGFVPDLVALYQGASGFLMSSRYEGFGLPPLEAMACGVPVVAFENSSVTEVIEGGGQLVRDGDVAAMTTAIRRVLDNPRFATEERQRGPARAAQFTWERAADIHAEVYRSVAETT